MRQGCPNPFPGFWSKPVTEKKVKQEFETLESSVKGDGRKELLKGV